MSGCCEHITCNNFQVTSLLSTATNLLIESIELKLSYTKSKIGSLQILLAENHKVGRVVLMEGGGGGGL